MKKALVIGGGMDVTEKERGQFIDSYFDDVIIVKYIINVIDEFKQYIGTPTILLTPGLEWMKKSCAYHMAVGFEHWYDPLIMEERRNLIYDNLHRHNIKQVWINVQMADSQYYEPYFFTNKRYIPFRDNGTAGMNAILQAIEDYDQVAYIGFDGHLKGVHFFHHVYNQYPPYKDPTQPKDHEQYFKLKRLESEGKIIHLDRLIDTGT